MKSGFFAAVAACSLLLAAPASAQGVKIGILNDQSGVYADYGGKYSVEAARMAIEDFGGEVLGLYLFEVKKPSELKKPWDYYKQFAVVPGDQAFFTVKESGCPLTK